MTPQEISVKKLKADELWKAVLGRLEMIVSPTQYKTNLIHTKAQNLTDTSIEIICPNQFARNVMEKQLMPLIQANINEIGKGNYQIKLIIGETTKKEIRAEEPLFENLNKEEAKVDKRSQEKVGLYSKYTFQNYIMGPNNQLAYAIATAVADNPGMVYNPFFLYSGVGLGKTHLMQAIGNKILQDRPDLNIIYCTGESFANELIESIKGKGKYTTNEFRNKYRKADVLLIDDIQFIAGRDTTQEEFFHTFNALHMTHKQIVMTSDRPPKDFVDLEERIKSRFNSGIIADIQTPDLDMRAAILRNLRDQNGDTVSNKVVDFIALKINSNIRELEAAYLQVRTYARAKGLELTEEIAAEALGQSIDDKTQKPVNINQVLKAVCNYYSVKMEDIKGQRRNKELVIPRQIAMYLIYDITQTPFISIGEFLGGRDHSTVIHGVRKIEEELKVKTRTKQDVSNIKQVIYT